MFRLRRLAAVLAVGLASTVMARAAPSTAPNAEVVSLSADELGKREIRQTDIGMLDLPTGEIIACDPLVTGPDWPALARKVKPGRYPVTLFEAQGRVGLAVLRLAPGQPSRWEMAVLPGQDASTLEGDEIFGYPVDAGLGSFMDRAAMVLLTQAQARLGSDKNYYDDVLAAEFAPNADRFVMHRPVAGNPLNIAMFWSGWGDGFYASYWGLDAKGEPLVLMTDFGVIENANSR